MNESKNNMCICTENIGPGPWLNLNSHPLYFSLFPLEGKLLLIPDSQIHYLIIHNVMKYNFTQKTAVCFVNEISFWIAYETFIIGEV